ncbi:MAG: hypothetical protein ACRDHZ_16840 [Ktedonobacteraceae bacterium]
MKNLKFYVTILFVTASVTTGGCVNYPTSQKARNVNIVQAKSNVNSGVNKNLSPVNVPLVRLLANPEKMNGRRVTTAGVLAVEVEGTALYLDRESYYRKVRENAVAIMPTVAAAPTLGSLGGQYVTVTGTFEGIPSFSRWPGGVLRDVAPMAAGDIETPSFATTHTTIQLTSSKGVQLGRALDKFASLNGFTYTHGVSKWHHRQIQSYGLLREDMSIDVDNFKGQNLFRVAITALVPWANWEIIRTKMTQYLHSEFGNDLKVIWSSKRPIPPTY